MNNLDEIIDNIVGRESVKCCAIHGLKSIYFSFGGYIYVYNENGKRINKIEEPRAPVVPRKLSHRRESKYHK